MNANHNSNERIVTSAENDPISNIENGNDSDNSSAANNRNSNNTNSEEHVASNNAEACVSNGPNKDCHIFKGGPMHLLLHRGKLHWCSLQQFAAKAPN